MSHIADQLEGFGELVEVAGRTFLHGQSSFRGLVKRLQPVNEAYDLTPTDDDTVLVSAFRSAVPAAAMGVGAILTDEEQFSYRVTRLQRSPNSLVVRLECTVLNP